MGNFCFRPEFHQCHDDDDNDDHCSNSENGFICAHNAYLQSGNSSDTYMAYSHGNSDA